MKSKEEFIKEWRAKQERETQDRLRRYRGLPSLNQERLFNKLGMRLNVSKPSDK
jgi:hypothetical protein